MQEYQKTEGVILQLIPYRDSDQIVILFTADAGLMKIMCYGSRSQKSKWRGLCRALTRVEIVYREKNGEIFECRDLTLIDPYESLKTNFNSLEAACDLMYALNRSQMIGREASKLYTLLIYYLSKMPFIQDPWILSLSFRLKLLRHDGLSDYPFICHLCEKPFFSEVLCSRGEMNCIHHSYDRSFPPEENELELAYLLTACRSYKDLNIPGLFVTAGFKAKVIKFFEDCLCG